MCLSMSLVIAVMQAEVGERSKEIDRKRLMELPPEERACELELRRIAAIENIKPKFSIF